MRVIAPIVMCAFAAICTGSANAADLPFKAPPPPPPVFSWTGLYVGGNVGGSIGMNSNTQSTTFSSTALGVNGLLTGSTGSLALPGWVAGGQIGLNWQVSPLIVLGIEADWQWTSEKGSTTNSTPPADLSFFGAGANGFGYSLATQQKLTDIATARARGGVIIHDTLWYITGGAAWGTVKNSYAFSGSANPTIFPLALQPGPFLASSGEFTTHDKLGWTIGAGVETRLGGGWSVKAEYLYVDLGTVTDVLPIAINPAFGAAFVNGGQANATSSSHVIDNIIRVGLNYKFFNN
jgi:outer membrane immunogenic protein